MHHLKYITRCLPAGPQGNVGQERAPAEFRNPHLRNICQKRHRLSHLAPLHHAVIDVNPKHIVLVMKWCLPEKHNRPYRPVSRTLQIAYTVCYLHAFHMIFPTSSYLRIIWHDMAKRTFFNCCVHVEWKVVTFNWSNHRAHMGNCAVYATHISFFFIWPSVFYSTELCTSTTLHTPNIFQWLKKTLGVGF
jgi:hypothetical protein